jgi:putative FmdB family regulatory protein
MPIYEYRCEKGHAFDVLQSMSDDPLTACEVCGAPVRKVMHAPAVHFKGSGFYTTDYGKQKTAGGAGDAKKEKAESNGSSGGSDSGSTSKKPEPKSGSGAKPDSA